MLTPYLLYIKLIGAAVILAGLIWFGWHEKGIRDERAAFKAEAVLQKSTAEMYALEFNKYIQLNREIADAIKRIKVQSNTYIDSVEVSQPPAGVDGDTVVLIPAGVPKAVPRLPGYQNYSAGGAAPAPS